MSAFAVAVLGLVGMACQPAPMELTLGVSRQGTYVEDPLLPIGHGVRLSGTIACTRPAQTTVTPTIDVSTFVPGVPPVVFDAAAVPCDGPDGNRWTHVWGLDLHDLAWFGLPGPFPVTVVADAPADPDTVSVTRLVTLTRP